MDADESPEWLTAEEQQTWLALAGVLVRLPHALDAELHRDSGMSHFEYQVLAALSMTSGHALRLSVLSTFCGGTLARLSQVITRLERRGWVERAPDPDDGRSTLAVLTQEGHTAIERAAPGHVGQVRRLIFDSTSKVEQRQLREACFAILEAIDPTGSFREQLNTLT